MDESNAAAGLSGNPRFFKKTARQPFSGTFRNLSNNLESHVGLEPTKSGFAVRRLVHFGI